VHGLAGLAGVGRATACGGYGAKVSDPKKVRPALERALAFDGPALVDIDVDPNEPPLRPWPPSSSGGS
jgi:thiamine pyrophosphate-dependent acetolactate synthase large subunit-like protein